MINNSESEILASENRSIKEKNSEYIKGYSRCINVDEVNKLKNSLSFDLTPDQEKLDREKKSLNRRFGLVLILSILLALALITEIVLLIIS